MAMPEWARRALCWAPRALGVLMVALLVAWGWDIIQPVHDLWETVRAVLTLLIPIGTVAGTVALAWRAEWVGAVVFLPLALAFTPVTIVSGPLVFLVWVGPLALLGGLYLAAWKWGRRGAAA